MSQYTIKPGRLGRRIIRAYKAVENRFVRAFLQPDGSLRTGAVGGQGRSRVQAGGNRGGKPLQGDRNRICGCFSGKENQPRKTVRAFPGARG